MNRFFEHKGLHGSIEVDAVEDVLCGKVQDIQSIILYSADTVADLRVDFVNAVDEYLEHCRKHGVEPERPYGGTFNVRVGAELHRAAVRAARSRAQTLNEFVRDAIALASGTTTPAAEKTERSPVAGNRSAGPKPALRTAASRKSVARKRAPR